MSDKNQADAHVCSQLVYLNLPAFLQGRGEAAVGEIARYYGEDPVGMRLLADRFGNIPREHELWKEFLRVQGEAYGGWRVADILDDNESHQSGFYGCAFLGPQGQRVVAFRGSELLGNPDFRNDYESDFALAYEFPTPQQKVVEEYWRRFGGRSAGELVVTGHSLGGNLALYGILAAPPSLRRRIGGCYAFNAPGFCSDFLAARAKEVGETAERLHLLQNRLDPVSSLLLDPVEPELVASRFDPGEGEEPGVADYFYPHSNFMYETDRDGCLVPADRGRKSAFCLAVRSLSRKVLELPRNARRELAEAVLAALYDVPAGLGKAEHVLGRVTTLLTHSSAFAGETGSELAGIAYAGAALLRSGGIKGYLLGEGGEEEKPSLFHALPLLVDMLGQVVGK